MDDKWIEQLGACEILVMVKVMMKRLVDGLRGSVAFSTNVIYDTNRVNMRV